MKRLLKPIVVCAAAVLPLTTFAAAPATESVRVTFAELDLRKQAGVEELYKRLRRASRQVCRVSRSGSTHAARQQNDCYEETLEAAVADVGNSLLERIHNQS